MGLDELTADVEREYGALGGELSVDLDRETKHELAMLAAAFDAGDVDELVRRGVHALYRSTVDAGDLDFHLRQGYDVTYDEYLMGVTMDTYNDQQGFPQPDQNDDRRYRF